MLPQRVTPNHRVVCHPYATQSRKRTLMHSAANDRSEDIAEMSSLSRNAAGLILKKNWKYLVPLNLATGKSKS